MRAWARRASALAAILFLTSATVAGPAGPASAQPPLKIRVPLVAATGDIPPAIVGSPTVITGATYRVYSDGGTQVRSGTVKPAGLPASADRDAKEVWSHYYSAALNGLPAGRYQVRVNGVSSAWFDVKTAAWREVLTSLLPIYRANADGTEAATPYHDPSHLNDAASLIGNGPHAGEAIDVRGGWMDAGDQLKFTVTIAYATALLELAGRNEAALRTMLYQRAAIGIRFLLEAHPSADVFVTQVGTESIDHNHGFRDPASDDSSPIQGISHRKTFVINGATTGGSDVAAMAAAALALEATHQTGTYRTQLVTAAEEWLAKAEALHKPWVNCCYQQDSWHDDVAFAHAALWRATGQASHATSAISHLDTATHSGDDSWLITADGYEVGALPAAELCGTLGAPAAPAAQRTPACNVLLDGGYNWQYEVRSRTAFGRAGEPQWAAVRANEAAALTLVLADRVGSEDFTPDLRRATGWFLGVNPWGVRMQVNGSSDGVTVTGGVTGPYHWTKAIGRKLPVGAVPGGPADRATIDEQRSYCCAPVVLTAFDTPQQVYHQADGQDYVMNEVGLGYNAPALLHFALLSPG